MKTKIELQDFHFEFSGYGHYKVTYTSPITGKKWSKIITNMMLIDATKNEENPKIKDLNQLRRICKSNY